MSRHLARLVIGFSLVFSMSLSVVGCIASSKTVGTTPPSPEQVAETQPPAPYRSLASVHNEVVLEENFQSLIKSSDPGAELESQVDRLARIHFRAQSYLQEFDARLDAALSASASGAQSAPPIMADDSYAKLVAAWFASEDLRSRVTDSYAKLSRIAGQGEPDTRQVDRDHAQKILQKFHSVLIEQSKGVRSVALQGLFHDLSRVRSSSDGSKSRGSSVAQLATGRLERVSKQVKKNTGKKAGFDSPEYRSEVQKALSDDAITSEIEALVPAVKYEVLANLVSREPAARGVIKPSPGNDGNLTGNTFAKGRWSLTYDDGPHPKHTMAIISELQRNRMAASFFWLARNVQGYPKIVQEAIRAGMDLGNHSYTHANLPKLERSQLEKEIWLSSKVEEEVYGFRPRIFRCPYGACGNNGSVIRSMIAEWKMVHVFWNVDSLDWQDRNPVSIYERVKKQMLLNGRGIILFHDIHQQSVDASIMLIRDLAEERKAKLIRILTVQNAIDELNSDKGMK